MKTTLNNARRGFLLKAGAALSVPLASVAASAPARASDDRDPLHARLVLLEDVNAIRDLNRRYVQHVNAGAHEEAARLFADTAHARTDGVRALAADPLGAGEDAIEIAAGRATARVHCTAQIETPIEPVMPLVAMARAQGGGVAKRSERGVLEGRYAKRDGVWKIERLDFRAT